LFENCEEEEIVCFCTSKLSNGVFLTGYTSDSFISLPLAGVASLELEQSDKSREGRERELGRDGDRTMASER